jgi:hypothetical protein
MAGELYTTQDRDEIIEWAQRRQAHAAKVTGVRDDAHNTPEADIGALRLGFPGYASLEQLEPMMWDEWFDQFQQRGLVFAFQRAQADGTPSNYYEIVTTPVDM